MCENAVKGENEYNQADDVFGIGALAHELATLAEKPTYERVYGRVGAPVLSCEQIE